MSSLEEDDRGPGAILARVREEQGLSQRNAADDLNLPIHIVDAIETNDAERLPAEVFTRGYIRAYAKLLSLDPEPLLTALKFEQKPEPVEPETPTAMPQLSPEVMRYGSIAGAALVVLVIGWWVFSPGDEAMETGEVAASPDAIIDATSESATEAQNPTTDSAANAGSEDFPEGIAIETEQISERRVVDDLISDENPQVAVVEQASDYADQPEEAVQHAASSGTRRLTPDGTEQLSLSFTEDCWVEIRAKDNSMLYANLGKAERQWQFQGQGPFQLLIGYAPGVLVEYNGEPISLAPHTRNNVARLVLGQ